MPPYTYNAAHRYTYLSLFVALLWLLRNGKGVIDLIASDIHSSILTHHPPHTHLLAPSHRTW